jgi:hypothetical protein
MQAFKFKFKHEKYGAEMQHYWFNENLVCDHALTEEFLLHFTDLKLFQIIQTFVIFNPNIYLD